MVNSKKSGCSTAGTSSADFIRQSMAVAAILTNIVPDDNEGQVENGGPGHARPHADLQPAYNNTLPTTNTFNQFDDTPFDENEAVNQIIEQLTAAGGGASDSVTLHGIDIAEAAAYFDNIQSECVPVSQASANESIRKDAETNVSQVSGREENVTRRSCWGTDDGSDLDDFVVDTRKPRKPSKLTLRRVPRPSTVGAATPKPRGKGQGKSCEVEATPSTSYKLIPIATSPKAMESSASILRRALTTKSRVSAASKKVLPKAAKQTKAKQQVTQRVASKEPQVVASNSITISPEAGCSSEIVPQLQISRAEQVPIQNPKKTKSDSDSESEFAIFSQPDDRNMMKSFRKRKRQIVEECDTLRRTVQEGENSAKRYKAELEVIDAELQRLFERRQLVEESLENTNRTLTDNRNLLDKARKKKLAIEKF